MSGIEQNIICISEITTTSTNADIKEEIIGGNGQGRARESYGFDWGDQDEEW
jgi:hypothetical protein